MCMILCKLGAQRVHTTQHAPDVHDRKRKAVYTLLRMGAFSHSAKIITLFIPGTPLKTTHLQRHA